MTNSKTPNTQMNKKTPDVKQKRLFLPEFERVYVGESRGGLRQSVGFDMVPRYGQKRAGSLLEISKAAKLPGSAIGHPGFYGDFYDLL